MSTLIAPIDVDMMERQIDNFSDLLRKHEIPEDNELWGITNFMYFVYAGLRDGYRSVKVENVHRTEGNKEQGAQNLP